MARMCSSDGKAPSLHHQRRQGQSFPWYGVTGPTFIQPCDNVTLAWDGGVPPYTLRGRWWPDDSSGNFEDTREWIIALKLPYTSFVWTAAIPPSSTVYIESFDSASASTSSRIIRVGQNATLNTCQSAYPQAMAATPGLSADLALDPVSSSVTFYDDPTDAVTGLSVVVGLLSLALAFFVFLYIRLRRRLKGYEFKEITMKKWANQPYNDPNEGNTSATSETTEKPWETFSSILKPQAISFLPLPSPTETSASTSKYLETSDPFIGSSLLSTQRTNASIHSSFLDNRSTSSLGGNGRDKPLPRGYASNPFSDEYSEITSTTTRSNTDDEGEEDDSSAGASASASKRHSTAETTISESNTIQSGRSHTSTAMSEQASTVGGASTVSDEYYHRRKACTISPIVPKPDGLPFLDPVMASISYQR